jgi:alpha-amylase
LAPGTAFDAYRRQEFVPLAEIVFAAPEFRAGPLAADVRFSGRASLGENGFLEVEKSYSIAWDARTVQAVWRFRARGGEARFRFAAEILFCLLAGNAPDRYVSWDGGARRDILAGRAEMTGVTRLQVVDEWLKLRCMLEAPSAGAVWRDAIETVSQSEGGYERVYQGTVAAPCWEFSLPEGAEAEARVHLEISEEGADGSQGA